MAGRRRLVALAGVGLAVLLVVGVAAYSSMVAPMTSGDSPSAGDSSKIATQFRILSQAHTDVCAYLGDQQANTNYVDSLADNYYLQGSCCTPMDYNHYVTQINGLRNYSNIAIIPEDPYNVSASLAKQMLSYAALTLAPAQQAVYDNAMKISNEGPCCCQCWAWYAHEGLAKALISQHAWNGQQVANLWDLEDCCGG